MGCGSMDFPSLWLVACLRTQRNLFPASTGCSHGQLTVSYTFPCIIFDLMVMGREAPALPHHHIAWRKGSSEFVTSHFYNK